MARSLTRLIGRCRPDTRQGHAAGRSCKKALKPARRRLLVDEVRQDWKVSIRRACACLRVDTSLYHYKSKRGDEAALKARIKEITATRVRYGYRGEDVVATLERTCRLVGYPKTIRVDQDSEFISRDLDLWAYQRGVDLDIRVREAHGQCVHRVLQ